MGKPQARAKRGDKCGQTHGNEGRTSLKKTKKTKTKNHKQSSQKAGQLSQGLVEAFKDIRSMADNATLKKNRSGSKFRLGSDCSGMGSDLLAIALCGLSELVEPVFWSDNDGTKRQIYKAVSEELGFNQDGVLYPDMTKRKHEEAPGVDLYIAGLPCPSFSNLGKKKGVEDSRGQVGLHGLRYCIHHQPAIVLLENVKGFLHKRHEEFRNLVRDVLKKLYYRTYLKVLDTKEFGLPQSRPRVYIVALRQDRIKSSFHWPEPQKLSKNTLGKILDVRVKGNEKPDISNYERKYGNKVWQLPYVLDIASSESFQSAQLYVSPCLTRSRLKTARIGYYVPKLMRRLTVLEAGRLQGIPHGLLVQLLDEHSEGNVGAAIGDGMSLNVLCKVILATLAATGYICASEVNARDPWRPGVLPEDAANKAYGKYVKN